MIVVPWEVLLVIQCKQNTMVRFFTIPVAISRRMPRTTRRFWILSWSVPSWASLQHRWRMPTRRISECPSCCSDAQWCREDSQDEPMNLFLFSYFGTNKSISCVLKTVPFEDTQFHPISISLRHLMTCDVSTLTDARCIRGTSQTSLRASAGFSLESGGQQPGECNFRGVLKGMDLNIFFKHGSATLPVTVMSKCPCWWLVANHMTLCIATSWVQILELRTFERGVCARKIWAYEKKKKTFAEPPACTKFVRLARRNPWFQDRLGADSISAILTLSTEMRPSIWFASTLPFEHVSCFDSSTQGIREECQRQARLPTACGSTYDIHGQWESLLAKRKL